MCAEHQSIRRRRSCQKIKPCGPGHVGIGVSARRPLRVSALNRVVHNVTRDHAPVADPHTHVPGGCALAFA